MKVLTVLLLMFTALQASAGYYTPHYIYNDTLERLYEDVLRVCPANLEVVMYRKPLRPEELKPYASKTCKQKLGILTAALDHVYGYTPQKRYEDPRKAQQFELWLSDNIRITTPFQIYMEDPQCKIDPTGCIKEFYKDDRGFGRR